jgi:hypothetical protein|uniref:Uncharacterized protein n=1 Tax=Fagus sylvatica TaxID=28930 RepID=A0A2N9IFT4_FAGSY
MNLGQSGFRLGIGFGSDQGYWTRGNAWAFRHQLKPKFSCRLPFSLPSLFTQFLSLNDDPLFPLWVSSVASSNGGFESLDVVGLGICAEIGEYFCPAFCFV